MQEGPQGGATTDEVKCHSKMGWSNEQHRELGVGTEISDSPVLRE